MTAISHIEQAVRMEPGNAVYRQAMQTIKPAAIFTGPRHRAMGALLQDQPCDRYVPDVFVYQHVYQRTALRTWRQRLAGRQWI